VRPAAAAGRARSLVLPLIAATWAAALPAAAAPLVSQTLHTAGLHYGGQSGTMTESYTSVADQRGPWRGRATLGWWWWRTDAADLPPSDSGPGDLYLTAGRRLLRRDRPGGATALWLQAKAAVPLRSGVTAGGSGRFDWGASLLGLARLDRVLVLAEAGYLHPGDPPGYDLRQQGSLAVSASWRPPRLPVYPVVGWLAATRTADGEPGYGQWSAGLGALPSPHLGLSLLVTGGTGGDGPGTGVTAIVSVRP